METIVDAVTIDCDFPGGNIHVNAQAGDQIWVQPDQCCTDPEGPWFYWCFRVRGAQGRKLLIHFEGDEVFGPRGPAVSLDGGGTWCWLGICAVQGSTLTYSVPLEADEVRFAVAVPYTGRDLERFLAHYAGHPHLAASTLCQSRQGRRVDLLHAGQLNGQAPYCLALTARHHCCETMASYELEGLLAAVLRDDVLGRWYQKNVEVLAVPLVDRDGVEHGEQGKNRLPHDHNRDYLEFIYPETAAIRAQLFKWSKGRPLVALDLHCPWLRGGVNERISILGGPDPAIWAEVKRLSACLEACCSGPLCYSSADNMPFGTEWNVGFDLEMKSFHGWISRVPGTILSAAVELPYADASGQEVNPHTARAFGGDLAQAIADYLQLLTSETAA